MAFCTGCGHEVRPDVCRCVARSDLARVTAERDALRAEVEAMHNVMAMARSVVNTSGNAAVKRARLAVAFDALDAMRALDTVPGDVLARRP
jgi:hypothetical protein